MGLILDAVKKTAAKHIASVYYLVNEEMDKLEAAHESHDPGSTTSTITDFEKPELLEGAVVARRFRIGFNSVTADGAGNTA